jgi:putative CocE/NonD family hydrolase
MGFYKSKGNFKMPLIRQNTIIAILHFKFIVSLFIFTNLLILAKANAQEIIKFNTPSVLLENKVINKKDSNKLLKSEILKKQLLKIASQIQTTHLSNLSDNEVIAISSILGNYVENLAVIAKNRYPLNFYHYSLYAHANKSLKSQSKSIAKQIELTFKNSLPEMSDETLHKVSYSLSWSLSMGQDYMLDLFNYYQKNDSLTLKQAVNLIRNYQLYKVYESILPIATPILSSEQNKRYLVQTDVLVKTPDGAMISAIVVRKRGDTKKRPTAFQFSIYADTDSHIREAIHAVSHGYIGVIATTRGKAKSPDKIVPWEHDGKDATAVIDWISNQEWSDGRVGMYGGSYVGFTQWAAAKHMHPALKTIVPYEAANPMVGLPVENNIFITPNYQWAFHVTNNKTMDHTVYTDWQHWQSTYDELYTSGRAFKDIDKIEGTSNPWFQKWLSHPSYDKYYQNMMPYEQDYEKINIPVLSITGYYGASISALDFLSNHYKYNKSANHSLLIGPYSHGTAQGIPRSYHSNYKLDEVALEKDTKEMTFQWFDHVFYGQTKPKLIKDKVNYQLMGSNTWQHAPSLSELNAQTVKFHLGTNTNKEGYYILSINKQNATDHIKQTIDLTDRTTQFNIDPRKVIHEKFEVEHGLIFATKPFIESQQLAGSITGQFALAINKKDVDIGFNFYELKPNGDAFHLSHYISRASYAKDMSKRELLKPNIKTIIPIINSKMTAKLIGKGSRIIIVLDVNKNSNAQVNLGTGKDVSDETIADAGEPLQIKWYSDSEINIPIKKWITE